jgi:hypothetical protein
LERHFPFSLPRPATNFPERMHLSIPPLQAAATAAAFLLAFSHPASAAVTGRVVDASGKPVAGVALALERQGQTGVSDAQGRFSLGPVSLREAAAPGLETDRGAAETGVPAGYGASTAFGSPVLGWHGEAYSAAGRRFAVNRIGSFGATPYPARPDPKSAAAPAPDTLSLSKTAYLVRRVALAQTDTGLGDVILYAAFAGSPVQYHGFSQFNFTVAGKSCLAIAPKRPKAGNPWIWRTYFWDHKPTFDSIMCAQGYYLAFMDAPNLYGAPQAVALMDSFYTVMTSRYGFSRKTNLVGISRGAFYAYNWGRDNVDKISTLYGDGAGMDYVSWPCGCYGTGVGSAPDWTALKNVFGFTGDAQAKAYTGNPYQNMKPFALKKIPIIHVYGEADDVAPPKENVLRANDSLKAYGWQMKLLPKPNTGHVHGLGPADGGLPGQLDTLVQFVLRNTSY